GDVGYSGMSNRLTEEGDFATCEGADPDARTAPGRCKGILRIRLVPIDQDANAVTTTACGANMRWDGSACVQVAGPTPASAPAVAYECTKGNLQECLAQCDRGNAASCTYAGEAMLAAKQGTLDDFSRLYERACAGKHWQGCASLGDVRSAQQKDAEAVQLYGNACLNGVSVACTNYGVAAYFGRGGAKEDRALAFKLWERACRLGDFVACSNAGVVVLKGEGNVTRDDGTARKLFDVACKNGDNGGCSNLGFMFENGLGGSRDRN